MAGFVYFIQGGAGGLIKIGCTSSQPNVRFAALQIGSPVKLVKLGLVKGGFDREAELHRQFAHLREHGEWFRPEKDLTDFILGHAEVFPDNARGGSGDYCFAEYMNPPKPVGNESFAELRSKGWTEKIARMADWKHGWNGYDASPPNDVAIDAAQRFMRAVLSLPYDFMPRKVQPTVMGGIGIAHTMKDREVRLEFLNSGLAGVMFTSDDAAPVASEVETDPESLEVLLEDIARWLGLRVPQFA